MNGLYTEHCVKKNITPAMTFGKYALIALVIVLFVGGICMGSSVLSIIGVAGGIAVFMFVLPMFNMDYEYIFCDGQIDFDRITGGEKRKHMFRIDLDTAEIMAPAKSHRMDSYRNQNGVKIRDYSSGNPEAVTYAVYSGNGPEKSLVIFEPSEKMIEFSKQKSPRKVYTD